MVRLKSRYLLCEVNVSKRNELLLLDDRSIASAVRAAVARMQGDYGAALCSIRFSGTIRTCQKFLIRYNAQQLHRMLPKCKNEEEKVQVRQAILSCCLPGGTKEEFQDDLESEEDEEE
ncbi:ribonuclease P/MRP protein subunit POP5 isoform X2 [Austrofundulus limnaeus]|uniref:Ribonuclease P/MRP protein subunit POP5 isoform X2 n=1 Tax=Austrofundulus limnaeus TaxID=52670 RepID=A0A2I4CXQ5_AUSLI|nr:PREDICTED: ribonuclease P/MRP protein subunit POP5 isoform X2 [Austrofundulus limnaeus]